MSLQGMFTMEFFKGFSEEDTTKFEDNMIRWIRKRVPNPMLFFEKSQLKVGEPINVDGNGSVYQVKLPRLCLEYICINADMCILLKVTRIDGENNRVIYKIPNSWGGMSPWYADVRL